MLACFELSLCSGSHSSSTQTVVVENAVKLTCAIFSLLALVDTTSPSFQLGEIVSKMRVLSNKVEKNTMSRSQ